MQEINGFLEKRQLNVLYGLQKFERKKPNFRTKVAFPVGRIFLMDGEILEIEYSIH